MDNESDRVRLKRHLLELQYQKHLLEEEQQEIIEEVKNLEQYDEYFERMQWTNYRQGLEIEHKQKKQICISRSQAINVELKNLNHQIEKVHLHIQKDLEASKVTQEVELGRLIDSTCEYKSTREAVKSSPQKRSCKNNAKDRNYKELVEKLEPHIIDAALNIPKPIRRFFNEDEALEANLVDYRLVWYENAWNKSCLPFLKINLLIRFWIWLQTWLLVCIELGITRFLYEIFYKFIPLKKPRLPR